MAQGESEPSGAARAAASSALNASPWPTHGPLLLFAGFALLGFGLYGAALSGPFISDDIGYLVTHPYTASLSFENLVAIFDPFGPARLYTANYAPLHLLLIALERHIFADAMLGYHLVNVLVRARRCSAGSSFSPTRPTWRRWPGSPSSRQAARWPSRWARCSRCPRRRPSPRCCSPAHC
jgi:hypothetical protein